MEDLRIHFLTYNVGTSSPEQDITSLLCPNDQQKDNTDIYVISLQEVSAQPHNLLLDAFYEDPWTRKFIDLLDDRKFIKIKSIRMQGLVLSVFVKEKHLLNIRQMESCYTRTGLSGMWGNKGAVSIRLGIYGCSICFVNSHLAAHDNQLDERIEDYNSIIQDHEFHIENHKTIFFHDYVFWMGDLNFRLSEEYNKSPEEIERSILKGELQELFKHDQLRQVMSKETAFSELSENLPTFPPTFKFEVGENNYDHKRRPAWCDRILYKVHPDNHENVKLHADQKTYQSHPEIMLSDHKPVTADFVIKVFAHFAEEVVKFNKISCWWDNSDNIVKYEIRNNYEPNRCDWVGLYKAEINDVENYETYEYVPKPPSPSPVPRNKHSPRPVTKHPHDEQSSTTGFLHTSKKYEITFPQLNNRRCGEMYRLLYISENAEKVRSIYGMSELFHLDSREHSD